MNRTAIILASLALASCGHTRHSAGTGADTAIYTVPTDSIILSDPAVLADSATGLYYMTGTGGQLWTSPDLRNWSGPADVACVDTTSWMGKHPAIWAAELHRHNGRYYYFATFTNDSIIIALGDDGNIPRRASHILVADIPPAPIVPPAMPTISPPTAPHSTALSGSIPTASPTWCSVANGSTIRTAPWRKYASTTTSQPQSTPPR